VRNKREHDDEYFGSQRKEEKMSELPKEEGRSQLIVGQSCTLHRGGRILLGGTVDIHDVITEAEKLVSILIQLQHEHWESRAMGDIKHVEHFLAPRDLRSKV